MNQTTTIEIKTDTRRKLKIWKAKQELTYDEALNRLLEENET